MTKITTILAVALASFTTLAHAQDAATAPAPAAPAAAPAVDAEFDAKIRSWIERNPQFVMDTIQKHVQDQQAQMQVAQDQVVLGLVPDLMSPDGSMVLGNKDGTVEMVYVLDAACGYCHKMSPVVDEVIAANPDLKIVQRWVPFLTPSSTYAGVLAKIVYANDPQNYHAFYKKLMATEGQLTDASVEKAVRESVGDKADEFLQKAATGTERTEGMSMMEANMALAQRGTIQGTPFFMVKDAGSTGIIRGAVDAAQLNAAIAKARTAG